MAYILIGSSNVARFYLPNVFTSYNKYEMVKCTRFADFKARMGCFEPTDKFIIISVIENFVVDAVGETPDPETFDETLTNTINQFNETIKSAALRLPGTRFALVKPLLRPKHKWYMENYDEICEDLDKGIKSMGLDNVTSIDAISRSSQKFVRDEVHLTDDAGHTFVDGILNGAVSFFGAEFVNLDTDKAEGSERMDTDNETTGSTVQGSFKKNQPGQNINCEGTASNNVVEKLDGIERKVDKLEKKSIQTDRLTALCQPK